MKRAIIYSSILILSCTACNYGSKRAQSDVIANDNQINKTMQDQSFSTTILVDQTPEEVFDAINNVRGWWSEEVDGSTTKLNDEFSYHYKDIHLCKMKIVESIPGKKVVWLVTDNYFNFIEDKSEWKDTRISFDISKKGNQTQLHFAHLGLVPQYQCYEVCREAWTNYITNSLHNLIATGKGEPNPKEGDGYNASLAEKWNLQD